VTRKKDKGDVADVFGVSQPTDVANFQGWIAIGIEYLGCVLYGWLSPCVHEFLVVLDKRGFCNEQFMSTCRKTFPNIRSVSSLNTVEKMIVTRSGEAWM
jgi:hypothetical protein